MADQSLSLKQERSIAEAVAPVNLWDGAVSSGKTIGSLIAWCDWVINGPPGPLLMIGKSLTTLERNVLDPLQQILFADHPPAVKHTLGTTRAYLFGRIVHVMGAGDRTAEQRIRGLTLAGAYVDEASLLPDGFWPMLRTRLRVPGARLLATTNPDAPNHWLKRDVIDRRHELGFGYWHFLLDDNPALPDEYVAAMKAELSGLFYRRYIDGQWVAAHGAVYDMLDLAGRHRVTAEMVKLTDRCWLGVDYGTNAPFHAVLLRLAYDQRRRPVLVVAGEWRWDSHEQQRQLDPVEYEQRLRAWLASMDNGEGVWPERTAIDPTSADFRVLLRNRGWSGLVGGDEQINPVRAGLMAVSALLNQGRLLFLAGAAPELEKELPGYVWDEKAQERGEDAPLKRDDHGCDGLRYVVMAIRAVWRSWVSTPPLRAVQEPVDRPLNRVRR
ncbi:MAG: PBSX family phage terminase large subunit [Acidimicrobiales bacterium]